MEVLFLTTLFSVLFAVFFLVLFFRSRENSGSTTDQDALLPFRGDVENSDELFKPTKPAPDDKQL